MGIVEALISADTQNRANGTHWSNQISNILQRQQLKKLSKEYLNGGYYSQGELGRQSFLKKYGVDDATMSAIQNVSNIVATGGVDLGGQKVGNSMVSDKTGALMYQGNPDDYTLGDTRYSGATNAPLATNRQASDYTLGDTRYSGSTNEPLATNKKQEIPFYRLTQDGRVESVTARSQAEADLFQKAGYQRGESTAPKTGVKIESDGKGGFTVLTNADQTSGMATSTTNTVQGKALNTSEGLRRMRGIIDSFEPDFLKKPYRAKQAWNNMAEGWGLKTLDDSEELSLDEYTSFGRKTTENINLYIKEITGAQMSEKEADRLRLVMPDFGDGWWKGDGPTKFKSKMMDTYKQLLYANARYNYVMKNGFTVGKNADGEAVAFLDGNGDKLTLEGMKKIIDDRGDALLANGNSEQDVVKMLSEEFGVAF